MFWCADSRSHAMARLGAALVGRELEAGEHVAGRRPVALDHRGGLPHELTDQVARERPGNDAMHARRSPLVRVVAGLIQRDGGGTRGLGEHRERRPEAAARRGLLRRQVQRGEQPGRMRLDPLPPRQRGRHPVDAAGDGPELLRLVLPQPLCVVARRHALQGTHDVGERRRQPAPVVPQPDPEHDEHHQKDDRALHRQLDGFVPHVRRELLHVDDPGAQGGSGGDAVQLLEPLAQVDHGGLGTTRVAPHRDAVGEPRDRDDNEGRPEQLADARGAEQPPRPRPHAWQRRR